MRNPNFKNKFAQKEIRQKLRKEQTLAEALLWQLLRKKEIGFKFVRQYGIEHFVVDFCCRKKKLIIELDGEAHDAKGARDYDRERTRQLEEYGYQVVRFTNEEVLNHSPRVISKIVSYLKIL